MLNVIFKKSASSADYLLLLLYYCSDSLLNNLLVEIVIFGSAGRSKGDTVYGSGKY
jgi:hypothetical protein